MKIKKLFLVLMLCCIFVSCDDTGTVHKRLNGDEQQLPTELKGLQIYSVSIGGGNYVKVAVLNDNLNAITYSEGKYQKTTIMVNKKNENKLIQVSEILVDTDSILVCRK